MTLLLQILQTMLLTAVIICLVWTATSFSKNNTGYRWRKYLWLLLAVRLIIPINFDMPGYNAPINIAVTSEGIKSSNRFSSNEWLNNLSFDFTNTGFNASGSSDNEALLSEGANISTDTSTVNTDTSLSEVSSVDEPATIERTSFIQSMINLLYKAAASKITVVTVLALWLTVALVLGVLRVLQYTYARKKYLSCSEVCTDKELLSSIEEICSEYGIKKAPVILNCSLHTSPILMGYIKTMLIIPDLDYSKSELNYVIRHELNHYKAKDLWYKLLMVVLCDLYWFNPALRLMKHMAFQDTEFVCDENTTKVLNPEGKNAYCNTLLKVMAAASCSNLSFTTQFAGGKRKAMKRFENILSFHNKKAGFAILILILAAVIATTACVSVRSENPNPAEENTQTEETVSVDESEEETQAESDGKVSITLGTYLEEEELSSLQAAFPDYDINIYNGYNYYMTNAELTDDSPTVFEAGFGYDVFSEKFTDITDIVTNRGYLDNMSDDCKDMISDDNGRIFAVPRNTYWLYGLYCNTELFEAAGLVDENGKAILPTTWEDVGESAKAIREATGKNGLDIMGWTEPFAGVEFTNIAWNFGAEDFGVITEKDGRYTANINSEAAIAAMEMIKDLKWKYDALAPIPEINEHTYEIIDPYNMIDKVISGETAMCIAASDVITYTDMTGIAPEKLAVTSIPVGPGGKAYTTYEGSIFAFSANATEEQINAALDCLEYLGYTPKVTDAAKEFLAPYANAIYLNNAYAFNEFDSYVNTDFASYKYETLASEIDFETSVSEPAFANVVPFSNFRPEAPATSSAYVLIVGGVVMKVMTDENADVRALMDEANELYNQEMNSDLNHYVYKLN